MEAGESPNPSLPPRLVPCFLAGQQPSGRWSHKGNGGPSWSYTFCRVCGSSHGCLKLLNLSCPSRVVTSLHMINSPPDSFSFSITLWGPVERPRCWLVGQLACWQAGTQAQQILDCNFPLWCCSLPMRSSILQLLSIPRAFSH